MWLAEALAGWGRRRKGKTPAVSRALGFFCANPEKRPNVICRWDRDYPAGPRLSRPGARAGTGTREELLRRRICRGAGCGVVFWICRHCGPGPPVLRRAAFQRSFFSDHNLTSRTKYKVLPAVTNSETPYVLEGNRLDMPGSTRFIMLAWRGIPSRLLPYWFL